MEEIVSAACCPLPAARCPLSADSYPLSAARSQRRARRQYGPVPRFWAGFVSALQELAFWGRGLAAIRKRVAGSGQRAALTLLTTFVTFNCTGNANTIVIGSKNFTESILLGELLAQHLERRGFDVERKFNLGGSFIAHQAVISGQMDMYVEYTGTAHAAILELPFERDPTTVRLAVDSIYADRWDVEWTEPLGFENTYAMLVRGQMARDLDITSLSDAAPFISDWKGGFGFEFTGRADGLPGLQEWYEFEFNKAPAVMDLSLTYRALSEGTVDLIAGNSTDGQIEALDLFYLQDDRGFFPPYEAVPVVRQATLERFPAIREALRELGGVLPEATMRSLNYAVDGEGRDLNTVVTEFLDQLSR